jgi:hypothetical protein
MSRAATLSVVSLFVLEFWGCGGGSPVGPDPMSAAPTFTVAGVVRERPSGGRTGDPIANAKVDGVVGGRTVSSAETTADGTFRIDRLPSAFDLNFSKDGYVPQASTFTAVRTNQQVEVLLTPRTATLAGTVFETAPTERTPIAGVYMKVTTGPNAGASTYTNANGGYILPRMSGEFDVSLGADGYTSRTVHVFVTNDGSDVDLHIAPWPQTVTQVFESTPPCAYCSGPFRTTFPVHNAGEIAIIDFGFRGFEEGDSFRLQVWEDGVMLGEAVIERAFPRRTMALRVGVTGGKLYEVRALPQGLSGWYAITFTHPN